MHTSQDTDSPRTRKILPLNMSSQDYERIYHEPPPQHLGIALVGISRKNMDPESSGIMHLRIDASSRVLKELFEFDAFRHEFRLAGVGHFTVHWCVTEEGSVFWNNMTAKQCSWRYMETFVQVVFYDGDRELSTAELLGLSRAMCYLDRWIISTRTTEPSAHFPMDIDEASAETYVQTIGTLYSSGVGKWSESLIGFRNALMFGARAHAGNNPMLKNMRSYVNSGFAHYWESLA